MRTSRRHFIRLGVALGGIAVVGGGRTPVVRAQAPDWEPTQLAAPVGRLFTPAGGAFYARSGGGLLRSDDGGASWRSVGLPAESWFSAVDPVNHDVLYAANDEGLHKSRDGGATWALSLGHPTQGPSGHVPSAHVNWRGIDALAVSPADRNVVYLATRSGSASRQFFRSLDGGTTWDDGTEEDAPSPSFLCVVRVLLAHPTDPARLLRASGCTRAEVEDMAVTESADGGRSWRILKLLPNPTGLVGWRGIRPDRLYLSADSYALVGPARQTRFEHSSLHRSDDGGRTWMQVLDLAGAGEPGADRDIVALAYDPSRPDVAYIGVGGRVRASTDGGVTWAEVGRRELPAINDVALGIDGRHLYCATTEGLYRLPL